MRVDMMTLISSPEQRRSRYSSEVEAVAEQHALKCARRKIKIQREAKGMTSPAKETAKPGGSELLAE
jgi:hypothetical protein